LSLFQADSRPVVNWPNISALTITGRIMSVLLTVMLFDWTNPHISFWNQTKQNKISNYISINNRWLTWHAYSEGIPERKGRAKLDRRRRRAGEGGPMVRERRGEMAGRKYCFHLHQLTIWLWFIHTTAQTISTALNLSYPYFFFNKSSKLL
jgi:hypothetical protein